MAKQGLSRLQILDIIKRRGYFVVCKYSWRDDNLRTKLRKMRNEGLLEAEFCKKDIYYRMKKEAPMPDLKAAAMEGERDA